MSFAVLCAASGVQAQAFGGLYVHSGALAKQADDADAAAKAAADLKPYDDQLAALQTLATQEDKANATLIVARRDAELTQLIALTPTERLAQVRASACTRLDALVVGPPKAGAAPASVCGNNDRLQSLARVSSDLDNQLHSKRDDDLIVASDVARIAREHPGAKPANCEAPDDSLLPGFSNHCAAAAAAAGFVKAQLTPGRGIDAGSLIDTTHTDADKTAAAANPSRPTAALEAQIKTVIDGAKSGELRSLDGFSDSLGKAIKTFDDGVTPLDAVLKSTALKHLQGQLDQLSLGASCAVKTGAGGDPASAIPASGDCKTLTLDANKSEAVTGLLRALAAQSDIVTARAKSARWLAAANAIVTAYKTDADLQAAADKAAASAAGQRLQFMVKEASLLATTIVLADGGAVPFNGQPGYLAPACPAANRSECALAYYLAAWNEGRAPVQVLAYRKLQAFRETAVKRQRAAAAEEQALMLSGTGALKAYADGGLDLSLFAQLLVGAGLIGTAAK